MPLYPELSGAYEPLPDFPRSFFTQYVNASAVASRGEWVRVRGAGTITKLGTHFGTQSGNICVAVYANTGTGRAAKPGVRKATSGSVVAPAPGYGEVSLGGSVAVVDGDWFYIAADNAIQQWATGSPSVTSALFDGFAWWAAAAFPAADPAPVLSSGASRIPFLVGVA